MVLDVSKKHRERRQDLLSGPCVTVLNFGIFSINAGILDETCGTLGVPRAKSLYESKKFAYPAARPPGAIPTRSPAHSSDIVMGTRFPGFIR